MTQQPSIEHAPTPWKYRPLKYDDWGFVRDASGQLACIARGHDDKDDDQHRRENTDLYAVNAAFIVEAVNSHEALKARIEELEGALREMTKTFEPFSMKPVGAPNSSARLDQEWEIAVHRRACCVLSKGTR